MLLSLLHACTVAHAASRFPPQERERSSYERQIASRPPDCARRTRRAAAFGLTPTAAFADEQSADGESARNDTGVIEQLATQQQERWDAALATGDLRILADESIYNAEDDGALLEAREALPSSYDLRDKGVVTPVKRQNPWGTCWGFAAIAAAETSILSEMGTTYEEFPLDLSERQLAWFARTALPEGSGSQAGEGMYSANDDPNERLNVGGLPFVATSVFSSGVGPVLEEDAPTATTKS